MTAREYLDRLDALHAASTDGPWDGWCHPGEYGECSRTGAGPFESTRQGFYARRDAEFIAVAHNTIPRLTNALRAVLAHCDLGYARGDDELEEAYADGVLAARRRIKRVVTNTIKGEA